MTTADSNADADAYDDRRNMNRLDCEGRYDECEGDLFRHSDATSKNSAVRDVRTKYCHDGQVFTDEVHPIEGNVLGEREDDADSLNEFFDDRQSLELQCLQRYKTKINLRDQTLSSKGQSNLMDVDTLSVNHVLVGYAFGLKKMSTMGLIMAEASNTLEDVHNDDDAEEYAEETMSDSYDAPNVGGTSLATCQHSVNDSCGFVPKRACSSALQLEHNKGSSGISNSATFMKCRPTRCKAKDDDPTIISCSSFGTMDDDSISALPLRRRIDNKEGVERYHRAVEGDRDKVPKGATFLSSAASSECSVRSTLTESTASAVLLGKNQCFSASSGESSVAPSSSSIMGTIIRGSWTPVRVSFVPLDLDHPLEEQHGGQFDVILHKLTEDILSLSSDGDDCVGCGEASTLMKIKLKNPSASSFAQHLRAKTSSVVPEDARLRLSRLTKYKKDHPSCCIMDDPENVKNLMSRADIARILSSCLIGATTRSGVPVRPPKYIVCWDKESVSMPICPSKTTDTESTDSNYQSSPSDNSCTLEELVDAAPFSYPLIAKPLTAAGVRESHKMLVLLGRDGLLHIETPCLLQEYLNHNERLFKVYVVGSDVRVFQRPSLPDLPLGENKLGKRSFVQFDSQKTYPKLSDFGVEVTNKCLTGNCCLPKVGIDAMKASAVITADEIRPVASVLSKAFGLDLFGFDVLLTQQDRTDRPEILVVDVNYFPSYKEVSNFPSLLAQYLTKRAMKSRAEAVSTGEVEHSGI